MKITLTPDEVEQIVYMHVAQSQTTLLDDFQIVDWDMGEDGSMTFDLKEGREVSNG